jgi:hypothetical protein
MKTEHEIKALPLEEKQKLVIELRAIKPGDKAYANAKAIIELITGHSKWKEPKTFEVLNITSHDVSVDGNIIAPNATGKIYFWQYLALARFLEAAPELEEELAVRKDAFWALEARSAALAPKPEAQNIADTVKTAIADGFASLKENAGKVAALIALLGCLLFASGAQAQVQTTAVGSAGNYHTYYVAGLNGGTNNIAAATTAGFTVPVTTTTGIITNASWNFSNGIWTNTLTFTTNTSVNVPGLLAIPNVDQFALTFGGASVTASNVLETASVDYSPDSINWQTNKWSLIITTIGVGQVTTNVDVNGCNGGYLRLNSIINSSMYYALTNIFFEVSAKASRTGPF